MNEKIKLGFNTAITGLEDRGVWNKDVHKNRVRSLRDLIMQIDGACGCYIDRYDVEVTYVPSATNRTLVVEGVQAAVRKVSDEYMVFPMRGKKIPSAHVVDPDTWWVARVTFDTDLFVDKGGESATDIVNDLTTRLANADGARQPHADQRVLCVKFDPRQVSSESMRSHIEKVVAHIMSQRSEKNYFPFAQPTFSYETHVTQDVI